MKEADRTELLKALAFALEAHGNQTRKGSDVPYASHLLQVAGLVLEHGGGIDQAIAALLHDVVEDCEGVTQEQIERRFGPDVARIVGDCTDTLPGDRPGEKSPWRLRKESFVGRLEKVDARSALVCVCDKRHNLGALVVDVQVAGTDYLERFSASGPELVWYFEAILAAVRPHIPAGLRDDYEARLDEFRKLVG